MENAVPNPGSAEAVFVQSIVSDLTEEEQKQLDPILDQITMQHISLIQDPRPPACAGGPHTHDGLQFVDKAPEAYIVLHKMSTDETDGMIEDCFQALAALDTAAP